jgi:hypothetical protein
MRIDLYASIYGNSNLSRVVDCREILVGLLSNQGMGGGGLSVSPLPTLTVCICLEDKVLWFLGILYVRE